MKGTIRVSVQYKDQEAELSLTVVAGNGTSLLGRDWLLKLRLDWPYLCVNEVRPTADSSLSSILDSHAEVFKDELGLVKGTAAKLYVDPSIQPRFCQARSVPYALRDKVFQELDWLEKLGIIEPVQFSDWAAPIVPVVKQDGTVRICGDYKVIVNTAAKVDSYPLPRVEDLLASMHRKREDVHKARFGSCVPPDTPRGRITAVGCPQHPEGVVQVYPLAFRGCLCPCHFSTHHGKYLAGHTKRQSTLIISF